MFFLFGIVRGAVSVASNDPLTVLTVILIAVGVALLAIPYIERLARRHERPEHEPVNIDQPPPPTRPLTWGDLKRMEVPLTESPQSQTDSSTKTSARQEAVDASREALVARIEEELVAIIDEWRLVRGDAWRGTDYGTYRLWSDKTSAFIRAVLGDEERQRFEEKAGETSVDSRIETLERLRDNPGNWKIQVDVDQLSGAIVRRRQLLPQERIVLAGTPALAKLYELDPVVAGGPESERIPDDRSDDDSPEESEDEPQPRRLRRQSG